MKIFYVTGVYGFGCCSDRHPPTTVCLRPFFTTIYPLYTFVIRYRLEAHGADRVHATKVRPIALTITRSIRNTPIN